MKTKKYIIDQLEEAGVKLHPKSLDRYIRGARTPRYETAKALCLLVGGDVEIWLDSHCTVQRKVALGKYARKIKGTIFFDRGRPKVKTKAKK